MAKFTIEFQSKCLLRKTEITVIYPTMNLGQTLQNRSLTPYQDNLEKFPLVFCLHGFGDSKSGFETHLDLEELAQTNKVGFVLFSGESKWYLNFSPVDRFYDFLNSELPDFIYGTFNVFSKEMPKYIVGVSMGGYGALFHYLNNVNDYKACCSLSPATRPDNNLEQMLKVPSLKELFINSKDEKKNIYLSIGTKDFIIEQTKEFNNFLIEENVGVEYKFVEGYTHSWELWRLEIVEFFKYIKSLD